MSRRRRPREATSASAASPQLFHDTYAHMLDEIDADAAAKLQRVIGSRTVLAG